MECCVHSPCGRYLVRFSSGTDTMCIEVVPKASTPQSFPSVHYVAVLNEQQVDAITTAAGVRKEFRAFSDMAYNALVGRSPCVKFFIETCEEMKGRITAEVASRGPLEAATPDTSGCSELSDASRAQRFFTLDYDVDFTRAVFPVPLAETPAAEAARMSKKQSASPPHAPGDAEHRRLLAENERLRRENAALTRLSREKMLEMQRLCEDFQRRVDGGAEASRLAKKLTALRERLRVAEGQRDEARAAAAKLRQQLRRPPQSPSERSASARGMRERPRHGVERRPSRFDTPPVGRRFGDSPAPLGRSGGRPAAWSRSRSRSTCGAEKRRGRLASPSGSSCGSAAGSRCSSRGSCERLYSTPTASSRMRRREEPLISVPRRSVFR